MSLSGAGPRQLTLALGFRESFERADFIPVTLNGG